MMGGEIGHESREGEGSRFSFTLRFIRAEEPGTSVLPGQNTGEYDFTGRRILLVEDNVLNTEIAKTLLEMHGFIVDTAGNGKEGVDKFAEASGRNLLRDSDGYQDAGHGRSGGGEDNPPDGPKGAQSVPIIAMTANAFDEDTKKPSRAA